MLAPKTLINSSPARLETTTVPGPQIARPNACRMMPNPSVLTTQANPGLPAKGRTPTRNNTVPTTAMTSKAAAMPANCCTVEPDTCIAARLVEPDIRISTLICTNAPTETKSPWAKFSVRVVVKVMLKPSATSA